MGRHYSVPYDSWFFFINDRPIMSYIHERRFVFVDARDAEHYEVFTGNGFWPVGRSQMDTLDLDAYEFRSYEDDGNNEWMCRPTQTN